MADQPSPTPAGGGAGAARTAPVNSAPRPAYRLRPPPPQKIRRRRFSCCRCCFWMILVIILLIFLAAIVGAALYILYRPQRPSVTVNSLRLTKFNLTDTAITTSFKFIVTVTNPNNRIDFIYDRIALQVLADGVDVGDGSFDGFIHGSNNVTNLDGEISKSEDAIPPGTDVSGLQSSVRRKRLAVEMVMDTKVRVRIGKLTTTKLKVRVICRGTAVPLPAPKADAAAASTTTISGVSCKAQPIIKVVNWNIWFLQPV